MEKKKNPHYQQPNTTKKTQNKTTQQQQEILLSSKKTPRCPELFSFGILWRYLMMAMNTGLSWLLRASLVTLLI